MTDTETAPAEATPKAERATIARDAKVLTFLTEGGKTRKEVVAFLHVDEPDLSASQAYLTLNRLKAAGKASRAFVGGEHRWSAVAAA